jgi:hypothetical protein
MTFIHPIRSRYEYKKNVCNVDCSDNWRIICNDWKPSRACRGCLIYELTRREKMNTRKMFAILSALITGGIGIAAISSIGTAEAALMTN